MSDSNNNDGPEDNAGAQKKDGLWQKPWSCLWQGIPIGGVLMFVTGIIFWGGFNTAMELTNTMAFCTGCHEMS
jgi:cytochrome c-type protein NapC